MNIHSLEVAVTELANEFETFMSDAFARNEPDENRRRILLQALDVFAAKGLRDARIQDIAQYAGFSQGYVYRYFPTKEHIFARLLELAGQGAADTVGHVAGSPGPAWPRIHALAESMLNPTGIAMRHWRLNAVQLGSPQALDAFATMVYQIRAQPILNLIPLLQQGQEEGTVVREDPLMLSVAFFSMLQGLGFTRMHLSADVPFPDTSMILKFLMPLPEQREGRQP
jgi:AcrR family transcriptional regulator